jgi:hypothetical protein
LPLNSNAVSCAIDLLGDCYLSELRAFRAAQCDGHRNPFPLRAVGFVAIFLIIELDHPSGTLIQISSAPLRNALASVGK